MTVEPKPETKNCPFCGEEILSVAIKCKHCASNLAMPPAVALPATQPAVSTPPPVIPTEKCTSCQMDVPANAKRCPYCQTELKPGCLKSGCLLLFFGLGALFFLGIGGMLLLSGFKD